jgi:hypothetical protein
MRTSDSLEKDLMLGLTDGSEEEEHSGQNGRTKYEKP